MSFKSNIGKQAVDVGNGQCEMVNVHHPDCTCSSCKMSVDVQCLEPFVGTVPDNTDIRVCGACAVQMEREDFIVAYRDETRFVIVHPEMGVYLGSAIGFGFWSKCDPVGQTAAVTFPNRVMADDAMKAWDSGRPDGATIWPVLADQRSTDGLGDDGVVYASVAACVAAGLPSWDPDAKPSVR